MAKGRVNRVCTPGDLDIIARLRARGRSWPEVAAACNTSVANVLAWYQSRVEPVWRALTGKHTHEELARLNEIERECWRQYEMTADTNDEAATFDLGPLKLDKSQTKEIRKLLRKLKPSVAQMGWLQTIMSIIDLRARLRGDYAPKKSEMSIDTSVRVAGSTPGQVGAEMLARLASRVKERLQYEAALRQSEGSRN